MKDKTAGIFRLLALVAVMFIGISVIIPQYTVQDDEIVIPAWSDVGENDECIKTVFVKGLIYGNGPDKFGVDDVFTASEAAYAAVRMYEEKNKKEYSFDGFGREKCSEYIDKARSYGIWADNLPTDDEGLTRRSIAAVLAPLVDDNKEGGLTEFYGSEEYKDSILKLYNLGIALDSNIVNAFSDTPVTKSEAAQLVVMCIAPQKRLKIVIPDTDGLKAVLESKMSEYQGDWSLYYEDYNTGSVISINSHQVYSASLIKLFVAQAVYEKANNGTLSLSPKVEDEIRKMITYSDNDAWKYLARLLGGGSYSAGMTAVTKTAQASGFSDTGQFYQGKHKNFNFTSVNDCGRYLRGILNGTIVSYEYSEKILSLLKQQQHTQKIPAGVPDGIETANKTGELDYVQGDAAIVYAPDGPYILVIIGDNLDDGYSQINKITDLSKIVYEYLNKAE